MQEQNDKNENKLTVEGLRKEKFYCLLKKIKETKSIEEKIGLFFKCIPVVFWQPKNIKEILGPFTSLFAFRSLNNGINSYPKLDAYIENEKTKNKNGSKNIIIGAGTGSFFETLAGFLNKRKMSFSDLDISDQEMHDSLRDFGQKKITSKCDLSVLIRSLIESQVISNIDELKFFCTDDTENIIGKVICDIVFENLDVIYNSDCESESELVQKFKIPDWLMDCIFENYMERYMKKNDNEDYTFMFSYEINNEKEKWLEKAIIKTVQNIEIDPIRLTEYFCTLADNKFDLDPKNGGFISKYYDDNVDPDQMEEIDRERYFWFYMSYIRDEERMKNCNKDQLGVLFLTLLGRGIIYSRVAGCFADFLETLDPTEEQIKNAFVESFSLPEDKNWLYDWCNAGSSFAESMCLLGEKFFRPITFAIMNTMDVGYIEDLIFCIFSGVSPDDNLESDVFDDFLTEEDKPKLKILLDNIYKLDDKQKLISMVALAGNRLHIIDKVMMQEKFGSCFDLVFNNYIHDDKKNLDVKLLYKIIECSYTQTLVLTDDRNRYIRSVIMEREDSSFKEYYYKNQLQQLYDSKQKKETSEKTMPALDEKNISSYVEETK